MVDVKFVEKQLKELATRSREKVGHSKWSRLNEFIYKMFTGSQVLELTETVRTLQTTEKMVANLEDNLDNKDYEVLKKEKADGRVLLYIRTSAHFSTIGHGALITVELEDYQAEITIYKPDIPTKSINPHDLMDYIAQTIVAPSKRSREIIVNKEFFRQMYGAGENKQVEV